MKHYPHLLAGGDALVVFMMWFGKHWNPHTVKEQKQQEMKVIKLWFF